MSIERLILADFRNVSQGTVDLHNRINFVVGDNGSGKSSLLEAIFYLAHGKSFRTNKLDNLVRHGQGNFVVNVKDEKGRRLGIKRDLLSNETIIKIDGNRFTKLSELAKNIAAQIVTPESFKLFFGGPKERRRFVDLGLFHVKHEYSEQWKLFSRVLKQRNACLRSGADNKTLSYWTKLFVEHSEKVAAVRENYVEQLKAELAKWLNILLPDIEQKTQVQYLRGWNSKRNLADVLLENAGRERKQGFSLYGAQKFDVKFLYENQAIETELSRGQQKLFLLALTLAQTKLIEKVKQVKPILLIDDIGAELDTSSRQRLATAISDIESQIIITAIEKKVLEVLIPEDNKFKMFHVKHGKLSEISE